MYGLSEHGQKWLERVTAFMAENILPFEAEYYASNIKNNAHPDWTSWKLDPHIEKLKQKAQQEGLWNLFLPDSEIGQGLSTYEYAPIAEQMGRSLIAPEIFNCNAPDTGNMEVLYHFGSSHQKETWLKPLLAGEIRSVFGMTEPQVASSDATNMETEIVADGDEVVIRGRKWWSTGLGHPNTTFAIVMGRTDKSAERHRQHSMVIVPLNSKGVQIERMLPVFGDYDAPYGHGEVSFNDVRVPKENVIGNLGAGFAIAQGRLGPGRIHHCMRAIGAAERSLELLIRRASSREAFGKPLLHLGDNGRRIAHHRMAIDQARLYTMHTAKIIDEQGVRAAASEIAGIKAVVPKMLEAVVDDAIQVHGGAGLSHDFPLTAFFAIARALRLADGPDEVHEVSVLKEELKKYKRS
ncbi:MULTISPECIES: acyl-CoA dehydrogenase family protein [Gammaproteobacteria]|uniref:acyl-CoA dehydrogenase family protein n=1 Tax=Gammaproteobacteria TaxID=1236 RepID=UPI000DD0E771|nr:MULTISPECIES: acyl-CoA dehydrogenase family protein [Gammaproteobacteria]RTE87356.1 acyl-CoA dehydrogenase [Aliidiomarina sp. B3213]TCZ92858.1 acyl-CoA dehydrogenase [Lysobacter sp. N42]